MRRRSSVRWCDYALPASFACGSPRAWRQACPARKRQTSSTSREISPRAAPSRHGGDGVRGRITGEQRVSPLRMGTSSPVSKPLSVVRRIEGSNLSPPPLPCSRARLRLTRESVRPTRRESVRLGTALEAKRSGASRRRSGSVGRGHSTSAGGRGLCGRPIGRTAYESGGAPRIDEARFLRLRTSAVSGPREASRSRLRRRIRARSPCSG